MYLHTAEMSGTLHRVAIFPANYMWWNVYLKLSVAGEHIAPAEQAGVEQLQSLIEKALK